MTPLSQSEKNALVAERVMGWTQCVLDDALRWGNDDGIIHSRIEEWVPCTDLNQAHQMEERIKELGKHYEYEMEVSKSIEKDSGARPLFYILHASAEERVDAALKIWGIGE